MKECEEKKAKKLELEENIRFLDEQCRSQETGKRELENNLDLLKKQEHLDGLHDDLAKNRTLLESMEFDKLKREYQRKQEEKDQYEKEVSIELS